MRLISTAIYCYLLLGNYSTLDYKHQAFAVNTATRANAITLDLPQVKTGGLTTIFKEFSATKL